MRKDAELSVWCCFLLPQPRIRGLEIREDGDAHVEIYPCYLDIDQRKS